MCPPVWYLSVTLWRGKILWKNCVSTFGADCRGWEGCLLMLSSSKFLQFLQYYSPHNTTTTIKVLFTKHTSQSRYYFQTTKTIFHTPTLIQIAIRRAFANIMLPNCVLRNQWFQQRSILSVSTIWVCVLDEEKQRTVKWLELLQVSSCRHCQMSRTFDDSLVVDRAISLSIS